jgi:hypothetical protein
VLWIVLWGVVLAVGALGVLVSVQGARFERLVRADAQRLFAAAGPGAPRSASPEALPGPVRRYLEVSGALGRAPVRSVRLRHGGRFRASLDGAWMPIRGEQYFTTDAPGLVWWGRIRMAPGLWVDGRDLSLGGEGNMLVRAASTIPLGDSRGPEMDQGALQRLLGEMTWFPTALLDERYVTWAPLDDASALATLRVGGREVSVTFHFGADGLPTRVTADRFRDVEGRGVPTPWSGGSADFREVGGLWLPFRMTGFWHVDGRERQYVDFEVEAVEFDRPEPY